MFDFVSCVRDSGVEIKILPPGKGVLICIEVRHPELGFFEHREITDDEARRCGNIDVYIGQVIDQMIALIGRKIARDKANKYKAHEREEYEKFWKHSKPSPLTEGVNN